MVHQLAIESTANVLQCSPPECRQCCSASMIAERLSNADWLTSGQWQQNSPGMAWKNIQNIQKCSLKSTDCGPQTANKLQNMLPLLSHDFPITQTDRGSCGWIIWHCRYYKEKSFEKMFFKKRPKRGETHTEIISVCNRMRKAWMITLISRFSVSYRSIWRLLSLRARPWLRACAQV